MRYRLLLVVVLLSLLSGCAIVGYLLAPPAAKPDKIYVIERNHVVLLSSMAPTGAGWTVEMRPIERWSWMEYEKYSDRVTRYSVSIGIRHYDDPPKYPNRRPTLIKAKLLLAGKYDEAIDYHFGWDDPDFMRARRESGGTNPTRDNAYGKVVEMGNLTCLETNELNKYGSRDPAIAGQSRSPTAFNKKIIRYCAFYRGDEIWMIDMFMEVTVLDLARTSVPSQHDVATVEEVEADFRQQVQRTFDSLKVYGFTQPKH